MASAFDIPEICPIKVSMVKISGKKPEGILFLNESFTKTPALCDGNTKTQSSNEECVTRISSIVSEIKVCINKSTLCKQCTKYYC